MPLTDPLAAVYAEHCINIQRYNDLFTLVIYTTHGGIMKSETRQQVEQLKNALKHLAGVCDGANSRDNHGFDGRDAQSQFIKDAVRWAEGTSGAKLSYKGQLIALRTVKKYHKQLTKAGLTLPDRMQELEDIVAADAARASEPPAPPRVAEQKNPERPTQQTLPVQPRAVQAASRVVTGPTPTLAFDDSPPDDDAPHPADFYGGHAAPVSEPVPDAPSAVESRVDPRQDGRVEPVSRAGQQTVVQQPLHELEFIGQIAFIKFGPSDKGWTICEMDVQKVLFGQEHMKGYPVVTVVGTIPTAKNGGAYKVGGRWEDSSRNGRSYGRQIKASLVVEQIPETRAGLLSWLTSIPGLGPVLAGRIVDHFGVKDCVKVLLESPERIGEISGIGVERTGELVAKIEERGKYRELIVWLGTLGLSHTLIEKVRAYFTQKGEDPQQVITGNPYRLMELDGIGFKKADALALNLQIPPDSPFRIAAGISYGLDNACQQKGHCFIPRDELVSGSFEILRTMDGRVVQAVSREVIERTIDDMIDSGRVVDEGGGIWPKVLWLAESEVAAAVVARLKKPDREALDVDALERWQDSTGFRLHEVQEEAVRIAVQKRVMILTGGPGTGKTTTTKCVVDMLEQRGLRVALAAPTGKAAKRLSQATKRPAQTAARLIGLSKDTEGNRRGDGNFIDADCVLLDESSMQDILNMSSLLRVMHPETQLILVGDFDQLPSVQPGRMLRDMVESGVIPIVRLTEVQRQSGGMQNQIIAGAHAINNGMVPQMSVYAGMESMKDSSFLFFEVARGQPEQVQDAVVTVMYDLQQKLQAEGRDDDPFDFSQVLIPQRSTPAGVKDVNTRLQREFNTSGEPIKEGHYLCTGDKVMQIKNNYDLDQGRGVFNGDVGYIVQASPRDQSLVISFDGRPVAYTYSQAEDLVPSYATTIHKSQGSEYALAIVVCCSSHQFMLCRQLLYTAVTRGKKIVVVIGDIRAVEKAVSDGSTAQRYSMLKERLRAGLLEQPEGRAGWFKSSAYAGKPDQRYT